MSITSKDFKTGETTVKYVGLCLNTYTRGGYDWMDTNMTIWDTEKNVPFSETVRSESYGTDIVSYNVDATPEVREAFEAHLARVARRQRIQKAWDLRCNLRRIAKECNLTYFQIIKLEKVTPVGVWSDTIKLLRANLRSAFRKSLKDQILKWVNDPAPKFNSPLSSKQWSFIPAPVFRRY